MSKDEKRTVNFVTMKPNVFNWVKRVANKKGARMDEFVGDLLEIIYVAAQNQNGDNDNNLDFLSHLADSNKEVQVVMSLQEAERQQHLRDATRRLAALYVETRTEEAAESLQQACDATGVLYESVIERAKADPFSSIIAKATDETKIEKCISWLTDIMTDNPKIESGELRAMAKKQGYNRKMLQRARNRILENTDTPYIDSHQEGNTWWYILKDNDGEELIPNRPRAKFKHDYPESIERLFNTERRMSFDGFDVDGGANKYDRYSEVTGY